MPYLHLRLCPAPGHAVDESSLARKLTSLTEGLLRKEARLTAVRIETASASQWFIGGESLQSQGLASYHLNIQVTAGTNTDAEVMRYLAAVHEAMAAALGPLHDTSYAVVERLPAGDWGYGGLSQAARRLQVVAAP